MENANKKILGLGVEERTTLIIVIASLAIGVCFAYSIASETGSSTPSVLEQNTAPLMEAE